MILPPVKRTRKRGGVRGLKEVRKHIMGARNGLNSFALIFKDEHINPEYHMATACLAGIDRDYYGRGDDEEAEMSKGPLCFFVDNPFQKARGPDKNDRVRISFNKKQHRYLMWLSTESVFAGCFITKNPNIMAKRGIVYNVDYPAKFVYQAAVLTRYVAEFPENVAIWRRLIKFVEPHLAVAMCHTIKDHSENKFKVKPDGTTNNNHQAWKSAEVGVEEIKKMVRHDIDLSRWDAMSINTNYRNVIVLWREEGPVQKFKWPKGNEIVMRDRWGDSWVEMIYNWNELSEFIKEFLKTNRLEELYNGK